MCRSECGAPECKQTAPLRSDPARRTGDRTASVLFELPLFKGGGTIAKSQRAPPPTVNSRQFSFHLGQDRHQASCRLMLTAQESNKMFGSRVMRKVSVFVFAIFLACPTFAANESREQKRLAACGQVFKEFWTSPTGFRRICSTKPNASL